MIGAKGILPDALLFFEHFLKLFCLSCIEVTIPVLPILYVAAPLTCKASKYYSYVSIGNIYFLCYVFTKVKFLVNDFSHWSM